MIDHVYCINLEKRPDRREKVSNEFSNAGIENVEFFKGTDGRLEAPDDISISKPEYGCSDSHIRIWKDVVEKGYETALIFEDDVKILPNFNEKLQVVLDELELDPEWDYINLGPFSCSPIRQVTPNLIKGSSYGAHCYLISQRGARKLSVWETKDLHYCQDAQIARSPIKKYYVKNPLSNQESFSSEYGILISCLKGDIGMERTLDWDFILKTDAFIIVMFILCVVLLVAFFSKYTI